MTLEWRPYKDKESVFWSQFKKEGDVGLVTKFKAKDSNGYNPDDTIKPILDGYQYWAKQAKGQKGPFWVIERKKVAQATGDPIIDNLPSSEEKEAHKSVQNVNWDDRQARIDKAHAENLAELRRQAQALENINETLGAILKLVYAKQEAEGQN